MKYCQRAHVHVFRRFICIPHEMFFQLRLLHPESCTLHLQRFRKACQILITVGSNFTSNEIIAFYYFMRRILLYNIPLANVAKFWVLSHMSSTCSYQKLLGADHKSFRTQFKTR